MYCRCFKAHRYGLRREPREEVERAAACTGLAATTDRARPVCSRTSIADPLDSIQRL